ncbi:olfactory receptor 52B2-like [Denticeps clupeoides]|uniref:olfactory receptor 52B2-like n=1 Tax=Denticeps clupeoides TaxID=299321 RepID=UPI0010A47475|nr:olfactory receptor 52B2-like [Denticeps clupeoides]
MMNNITNLSSLLILEGFGLSEEATFPAFLFATFGYMVIVFCNLLLIFTIILNRSLHQPMYLLLINLPINDLMGSSALFPQVLKEFLLNNRTIEFPVCVTQAFVMHIYGTGAVFILAAMAYDRYIAICFPLRYGSIMTISHLIRIIMLMWLFNLLMIGVLFYLLLRLPRCRSVIAHTYCDNPSLLKLVCADTTVNNIYGLLTLAFTQPFIVGLILYSYLRILMACFRSKSTDAKTKALQTCATHLIVFFLIECLGLFTIISYRLPYLSPQLRKFIAVSTLIFPPMLNPIIYGINTKEVKTKFIKMVKKKLRLV